jgi:CRISPR-associated protein Cas5d
MTIHIDIYSLHVWGEFACFTRPEMKVERVSYDVITPSAARAVFEAIFWKPAIRWVVNRVDVLSPIRTTTIRRNEVASKISSSKAERAMRDGRGDLGIFIEEERQQRAATVLKDVAYLLHAHVEVKPGMERDYSKVKLHEMFMRRAEKGQCFMQPYLGCREFPAYFEPVTDASRFSPISNQDKDKDLGFMLHDFDYLRETPEPRFFRAHLRNGRLHIPHPGSDEFRA